MAYLENSRLAKLENAFYLRSDHADEDQLGIPSSHSEKFYVRVWDPEQRKHIGRFSELNQYDIPE